MKLNPDVNPTPKSYFFDIFVMGHTNTVFFTIKINICFTDTHFYDQQSSKIFAML